MVDMRVFEWNNGRFSEIRHFSNSHNTDSSKALITVWRHIAAVWCAPLCVCVCVCVRVCVRVRLCVCVCVCVGV